MNRAAASKPTHRSDTPVAIQGRQFALPAETVGLWIEEVMPLALELVNWTAPIIDPTMTVQGAPVGERAMAPYGGFMLSWFESHTHSPKIYYLTDCRIYFAMARWCFARWLADVSVADRAFSDLSRARIAITNDVLQVVAATNPGRYSMIRHHALMLYVATVWLPSGPRALWSAIYEQSLAALRLRAERVADVSRYLEAVEERGLEAFTRHKDLATDGPATVKMLDSDQEAARAMTDYVLYTTAAVGLVDERWANALRAGWSQKAWLAAELNLYRMDGYLVEEFRAVLEENGLQRRVRSGEGSGQSGWNRGIE